MNYGGDQEILLLAGDSNDVELLLYIFRKQGYQRPLRVARDGEEALNLFFGDGVYASGRKTMPGLILLNSTLPKVGSLEVLRRLKSSLATCSIPLVMLAFSPGQPEVVQGYAIGLDDHVEKFLDFPEFRAAIASTCLHWFPADVSPSETPDPSTELASESRPRVLQMQGVSAQPLARSERSPG